MVEPLRADDPEAVARAIDMARAGEGFALALSRSVPPSDREFERVIAFGKLQVRWDGAGGVRAVATSPRLGFATRFTGELEPAGDGGVLRGTARNRTHWLWRAILVPTALAFAAVLVAAATEPVWALVGFAVVMLALCAAGWHWLGTVRSTAVTRGSDLYELAQALWEAEQTSRVAVNAGLSPDLGRPLTADEREVVRGAASRLRDCDDAERQQLVSAWDPATPEDLADLFEAALDALEAPSEIVETAHDVRRQLDGPG